MSDLRDRYQARCVPDSADATVAPAGRAVALDLAELQRQFAYDRFLQRLYARDQAWVLKGAAALLAREMSLRATRDVDLYRRAGLVEAAATLREALALDLGDWFTFEAGRSRQMSADVTGLTIAVTATSTLLVKPHA